MIAPSLGAGSGRRPAHSTDARMASKPRYRRVLLKLSGEALMGAGEYGIDPAILDRVAELELAGERARAARLRAEATDAYSRAWDQRARRRLETLLRRSDHDADTDRQGGRVRRPVAPPRRAMVARER